MALTTSGRLVLETGKRLLPGLSATARCLSTSRLRCGSSAPEPLSDASENRGKGSESGGLKEMVGGEPSTSPYAQGDDIPPEGIRSGGWKQQQSWGEKGGGWRSKGYGKGGGGGWGNGSKGGWGGSSASSWGGGGGGNTSWQRGAPTTKSWGKGGGASGGAFSQVKKFFTPKISGPVTGAENMDFGRHDGKSFQEIVSTEGQYTDWMIRTAFQKADKPLSTTQLRFVAFALYARQNPTILDHTPKVFEAPAEFLKGKTVVTTGATPYGREELGKMFEFFGGSLATAVSKKTDFLVLMNEKVDAMGKDVKLTTKYKWAVEKKVPILSIEKLIENATKKEKAKPLKAYEIHPPGIVRS